MAVMVNFNCQLNRNLESPRKRMSVRDYIELSWPMGMCMGFVLIVLTDMEKPHPLWLWVLDCIKEGNGAEQQEFTH